jgi:cytidylate kinase
MIVAIDGPAGAGKSTTARAVAGRLGFAYIDTGAMYRAVALAADDSGLQIPGGEDNIAELASSLPIELRDDGRRIYIGDREVTDLIRSPRISDLASRVAALPAVRVAVVAQQRRLALDADSSLGGAVLEGRDIQTVVFPGAEVKIFLTASPATRAERRRLEWGERGEPVAVEVVRDEMARRDERDSGREASPLRAASDAVVVETDDLTAEQVVDKIAGIVRAAAVRAATAHVAGT